MPRCRFCDQNNPAGATRCSSCGAELPADESTADSTASPATARSGLEHTPASLEQHVLSVLATRGKISAIKEYRQSTGAGLKEAKDAVETLAARNGVQPAGGSGCGATAAAILLATLAAWRALS